MKVPPVKVRAVEKKLELTGGPSSMILPPGYVML